MKIINKRNLKIKIIETFIAISVIALYDFMFIYYFIK